ncbi:cytidylyltransferase family protein [Neorickettsia helminthoeca str. Oregon]|uniref:Phosphatidate cytidylyltransferase n=1 Tax=Neorickettsia helminthoeca str. Oregon TaxID=1286528 RepID=X5HL37_9RICK|nr:phosphatidate cytidylyltransferase [Neorickettsia helminthoeca]AHX11819.1 cytidylyltransferase family protein [Neorickettsia helminthoeca str. Oregon]
MKQYHDLKVRAISSIVLLFLCALAIYGGEYVVCSGVLLLAVLSYREWIDMTVDRGKILGLLGLLVVILPNSALISIYAEDPEIFIWLLICVVSNDIGAYCIGRVIGGPKLLESISPNKTLGGFFGGLLSALIGGSTFAIVSGLSMNFVLLTVPVAIFATAGDLFESFIKRKCSAKDSGSLIPGHGGVLDRVDGFIFSAPFLLYLL